MQGPDGNAGVGAARRQVPSILPPPLLCTCQGLPTARPWVSKPMGAPSSMPREQCSARFRRESRTPICLTLRCDHSGFPGTILQSFAACSSPIDPAGSLLLNASGTGFSPFLSHHPLPPTPWLPPVLSGITCQRTRLHSNSGLSLHFPRSLAYQTNRWRWGPT